MKIEQKRVFETRSVCRLVMSFAVPGLLRLQASMSMWCAVVNIATTRIGKTSEALSNRECRRSSVYDTERMEEKGRSGNRQRHRTSAVGRDVDRDGVDWMS